MLNAGPTVKDQNVRNAIKRDNTPCPSVIVLMILLFNRNKGPNPDRIGFWVANKRTGPNTIPTQIKRKDGE